jgi:hypothetical protein
MAEAGGRHSTCPAWQAWMRHAVSASARSRRAYHRFCSKLLSGRDLPSPEPRMSKNEQVCLSDGFLASTRGGACCTCPVRSCSNQLGMRLTAVASYLGHQR